MLCTSEPGSSVLLGSNFPVSLMGPLQSVGSLKNMPAAFVLDERIDIALRVTRASHVGSASASSFEPIFVHEFFEWDNLPVKRAWLLFGRIGPGMPQQQESERPTTASMQRRPHGCQQPVAHGTSPWKKSPLIGRHSFIKDPATAPYPDGLRARSSLYRRRAAGFRFNWRTRRSRSLFTRRPLAFGGPDLQPLGRRALRLVTCGIFPWRRRLGRLPFCWFPCLRRGWYFGRTAITPVLRELPFARVANAARFAGFVTWPRTQLPPSVVGRANSCCALLRDLPYRWTPGGASPRDLRRT